VFTTQMISAVHVMNFNR